MKIRRNISIITTLLTLLVSISAHAMENTNPGIKLAAKCAACHGPKGNTPIPGLPKLAGQNSHYFLMQMRDFKQGEQGRRFNPIMFAMTTPLTEKQLKILALYFASQENSFESIDKINPKILKTGRMLYHGGVIERSIPACSACHGPRGKGNSEAGFPLLAGQKADYTAAQLIAYKKGKRKNDIHHMMTVISKKLTKDDIESVADYISQLH